MEKKHKEIDCLNVFSVMLPFPIVFFRRHLYSVDNVWTFFFASHPKIFVNDRFWLHIWTSRWITPVEVRLTLFHHTSECLEIHLVLLLSSITYISSYFIHREKKNPVKKIVLYVGQCTAVLCLFFRL